MATRIRIVVLVAIAASVVLFVLLRTSSPEAPVDPASSTTAQAAREEKDPEPRPADPDGSLSRTERDSADEEPRPVDPASVSPESAEEARRVLAKILSEIGVEYRYPLPESSIEGTIGTIETTIAAAERNRRAEDGPGIRDLELLHLFGEFRVIEQYEVLAALLAGAALQVKTDKPFDDYHRVVPKLPRGYIASLQLGDPTPGGPWVVIVIRSPDMMEASLEANATYSRYKKTLSDR